MFVELCVKRVCESSTSLLIAESLNTLSFCTFNGWALWFIWTRPDHDEHGVPKSLHMCRPCSRPDLELSPLFVAWTQAPMVAQISQPFILTWTPPFKTAPCCSSVCCWPITYGLVSSFDISGFHRNDNAFASVLSQVFVWITNYKGNGGGWVRIQKKLFFRFA